MKISHIQKLQLQSWRRLKDCDNLTFKEFLRAQPKIWWGGFVFLLSIWVVAELSGSSDTILRALNIGGILFTIMLYVQARLYWTNTRRYINWEQVNRLLEESA